MVHNFFRGALVPAVLVAVSTLLAPCAHGDQWDAPASYYSGATGSGSVLKDQLESIMKSGHILRDYGSYRYSAAITDQDPSNANNILLAYTRASVPATWDAGATWNREHVWPQSLQPGSASNGVSNALSDPFSLRPANPSVNSSRSNKPFGLASTTGSNGHQGSYYFPGDADKGDIARSLFYQDTRWDDNGISLVNGLPGSNQMGDLASLLAWHYLDPPDEFERRRNHTIYSQAYNPSYYSNNRNAFIDHPEYVWSIYVNQQNDSQITLAGGASGGAGSTSLDLDFGARLVGAAVPADQAVTINKSGSAGTYYRVETTGAATSGLSGSYNAFRSGSTDSEVLLVGLDGGTSTAGQQSGAVTIDNLDVTTGQGSGFGAQDGDDVINMSYDVLDHATPSFDNLSQQLSLTYDFGSVPLGGAAPAFSFDLFNLESTAGYTAGLDLDSVLGSGDVSALTTDLATFSDLGAGLGSGFLASFNTASAGSFSASYQLLFSDEDLPGASALSSLTLNLTGIVSGAALLGDTDLDGDIDAIDIDTLYANIGSTDSLYDIDLDGGAPTSKMSTSWSRSSWPPRTATPTSTVTSTWLMRTPWPATTASQECLAGPAAT